MKNPKQVLNTELFADIVATFNLAKKGTISMSPTSGGASGDSTFDSIESEIGNHRAFNHPLFKYLEDQSKIGFNAEQFQIFRDNFFCRTELTIPSIARMIAEAAMTGDLQAVVDTIQNLHEEGGYGNPNLVHSKLLLDSHNNFGERVFKIPKMLSIGDAVKSNFLVNEVHEYRSSKEEVFNQKSYAYMAGNTWAHELAADGMLDHFREALFEPYKGYFTEDEYDKVMVFFKAHKDTSKEDGNVEENHGIMARNAAERSCGGDSSKVIKMRDGAMEFLNRQDNLWNGMMREMQIAQTKEKPVSPRPNSPSTTSIGISRQDCTALEKGNVIKSHL